MVEHSFDDESEHSDRNITDVVNQVLNFFADHKGKKQYFWQYNAVNSNE
jgi:hypothetical protein